MNNEKMVSIIIITYKRSMEVLERAIKSALNQTYSNTEIIVVNDYPPFKEQIEELKQKYKNIKIIHNQVNSGACFSRNHGAEEASGDYLAFLDDDDEWDESKIEKQVAKMKPGVSIVYCNGTAVYSDGRKEILLFIEDCKDEPLKKILSKNCFGGCSFPLLSAQTFREIGGFDPTFKSSQDHDLWIRMSQGHKVEFVPESLVIYHISDLSITSNINNRVQGFNLILKKHNLILKKHKEILKKHPDSATELYYQYFESMIKIKQLRCALKFLLKSFSVFPYNLKIILCLAKRLRYVCKKRF